MIPFDPSRAIDPIRESGVDPNTLTASKASFNQAKWFVGMGSKDAPSVAKTRLGDSAKFDE